MSAFRNINALNILLIKNKNDDDNKNRIIKLKNDNTYTNIEQI